MATGICYTQSGGVKKYDGIVVPGVAKGDKSYNPGYENIKHDTSSVPGEDHYSFNDPSSYTLVEKGSSARDDCPLIIVTYYPVAPANPCYFNYKKKEGTGSGSDNPTYNINCRIWVTGDGHDISICGDIESHDGEMPIPVHDLLRKDVIDTHIKVYINRYVNSHVIDFELSSYTWNGYVTPHFKYTVKFPNYNDNIVEEYGIGGIHDDIDDAINTKNKTITSTYNKCIYKVNYYIK